jgi:hypothetical protein
MKYFLKHLVSNVMFVNGKPVPFEVLADNIGVIALPEESPDPENQALLKALTSAAANHILGVEEIDKDRYEDLKKNLPSRKLGPLSTPYPPLEPAPDQPVQPRPPVIQSSQAQPAEDASPAAQEPTQGPTDIDPDAVAKALANAGGFTPKTRRLRP